MKVVTFFESLKIGGGVEKVQAVVGSALSQQGHDVIYLIMKDKTPRNEYAGTIVSLEEEFIFGFGFKKILSLFRLVKKVSEFCKKEKIDVILGQGDFFYMVVALSKWLYRNPTKCVGVVHTTIGIWHPLIKEVLIFLLKKLDFIILISHAEKRTFIEKYGFRKEKCQVIYNSIDTKTLEEEKNLPLPEAYKNLFSSDKFIFINIGRCTYQKNQALLLKAFDKVYSKYSNTELVILGQGDLMEELLNQKSLLSSRNNVHFLGNQENVYPFLMNADCFVLSSRFEGFPMVLIEVANIEELPVLSTDCPTGPSELLEEEFLSGVDREDELSENMIKMIENSPYRDKNLSLLKSRKHLFSHETISSEWGHLFETWSS